MIVLYQNQKSTACLCLIQSVVSMSCPCCYREYELPRRYHRADDIEYSTVPRVMSCLHSHCQSCLQEIRERLDSGIVICPLCKQEDFVDNVQCLPLDVSVLKKILTTSKVNLMSFCFRCYDEVPSYSWCLSCQTSMCEFHHQDHKLSVNTSKHEVLTFKEISHRKIKTNPQLPPILCPDVHSEDATLYCHDCNHVTSVQGASSSKHLDHKIADCKSIYRHMRHKIKHSLEKMEDLSENLNNSIKSVKQRLDDLNNEVNNAESCIEKEFDSLRNLLNQREQVMKQRLHKITSHQRKELRLQLNGVCELMEDCKSTQEFSTSVLVDTENHTESTNEAAYLVSLAEMVKSKVNKMTHETKKTTAVSITDPIISISFNPYELSRIHEIIPTLGCIETLEDNLDNITGNIHNISEHHPFHSRKYSQHVSKIKQNIVPKIAFTLRVSSSNHDQMVRSNSYDHKNTRGGTQSNNRNDSSNRGYGNTSSSQDFLAENDKAKKTPFIQSVVIDARTIDESTNNHEEGKGKFCIMH